MEENVFCHISISIQDYQIKIYKDATLINEFEAISLVPSGFKTV